MILGLGMEPANAELAWYKLPLMTYEEKANAGLTSLSPFQLCLTTPVILRSLLVNRDNWYLIKKSVMKRFNILYIPNPSHALWVILKMDDYDKQEAFKINYMLWENFRDIILNPQANPTAWNELVISQINGSYSPWTTLCNDGDKIPEGTILQQSNSDCGKDVILPTGYIHGA
ncbi:hypothetical protein PISMIDRAFT_22789 [Pisolithus microcarpus 441]|uniref:Uncharacterized protein n=1 Tax=Pisolithus microcarpus 441 TaxID=765257 RepID=A0A0C9ZIA6_9AGAM|nr:hypothetical protein BKA83DRAFT_22789 [Pisolithus microcarpus]KIK25729.1 hypothetical protein PISMIDRAFT_22789 [Pisolithus microcarpus 441]